MLHQDPTSLDGSSVSTPISTAVISTLSQVIQHTLLIAKLIFGELHTCATSRDLINCFSSAPLHADKMASQAPLTPGKRGKKRNSDLNSVLPHHLTAILPYTNSPLKLHRSGFRCCLLVFIVLCYKTRSVCETH